MQMKRQLQKPEVPAFRSAFPVAPAHGRISRQEEERKKLETERQSSRLWTWYHTKALTRVLPPEIMSQIFIAVQNLNALDSDHMRCRTPLFLGRVCSAWRNISQSTPHLWAYFSLLFYVGMCYDEVFAMLKFYLRMSKHVGLTLHMTIRSYRWSAGLQEGLNRLCRMLADDPNAHNIRSLKFSDLAYHDWIRPFETLPLIESLDISLIAGRAQNASIPLDQFCHLRHVRIAGSGVQRRITLSWAHITNVTLETVSVRLSLSLLTRCPNLTTFRFIDPLDRDSSWHNASAHLEPTTQRPVCLRHLSHLIWTYDSYYGYDAIFPNLRMPALLTLVWRSAPKPKPMMNVEEERVFHLLIPNLPPTLRSLEFFSCGKWSSSLLNLLFSRASSLKYIHLSHSRHVFIADVLSLLLSQQPLTSDVTLDMPLPSLKSLYVLNPRRMADDGPEWREHGMTPVLGRLFQSQNPGAERTFDVHFSRCHGKWTHEMHDTFRLLRWKGLPFNVWADSSMTRLLECDVVGRDKGKGKRMPWR